MHFPKRIILVFYITAEVLQCTPMDVTWVVHAYSTSTCVHIQNWTICCGTFCGLTSVFTSEVMKSVWCQFSSEFCGPMKPHLFILLIIKDLTRIRQLRFLL